jgi:RHS repeat-associated protein
VNYVTRNFEDEVTDLEVKMPGPGNVYGRVRRFYRDNQWQFEDLDGKLTIRSDGSAPAELILLGSTFRPVDGTRLVFSNGRDIIRAVGSGWRLDAGNGNWRTFDESGLSLAAGRGATTLVQYLHDAQGRLTGQANAAGEQFIWYEWSGNLISSVRDAANNTVTYQYSGGRLSKVTDAQDAVTDYFYDGAGRMIRYRDGTGANHHLSYDGAGAALSLLDDEGEGRHFAYAYDKARREFYFRERFTNGVTRESWFDQHGGLRMAKVNGELVREVLTDGRNQVLRFGEGFDIRQEFNEWGAITRTLYPDGSAYRNEYDPVTRTLRRAIDPDGFVTEWIRDTAGNLRELREAAGTSYQRSTLFTYDDAGRVLTQTTRANDGLGDAVTTHEYDTQGRLSRIVDATGQATRYLDYDANGNHTRILDAENRATIFAWDGLGRRRSMANAFGHTWQFEHDAFNNLSAEVTSRNHRTDYYYNLDNQVIRSTNPLGHERTWRYGPDGKILEEKDEDGYTSRYEYDEFGRLARVFDPANNMTEYRYAPGDVEGVKPVEIVYPTFARRISYDVVQRRVRTEDWAGGQLLGSNVYEIDARGNVVAITDGLDRRRVFEWDGLGRLVKAFSPSGAVETYTYNRFDRIASYTSPDNRTWAFGYDRNGKLVREVSPTGRVRELSYTAAGLLRRITDATGDVQQFSYDDAGRRTRIEYFSADAPTVPERSVIFAYDADGNLTAYSDGATSGAYVYDEIGRKISETVNYGPFSKTFAYSYTRNGWKQTFTAPSGLVYEYGYDSGGRLQTITLPGYGQITYNAHTVNRVARMTYPGGIGLQFGYDPLLRPASLAVENSEGTPFFSWQVQHDAVNRIASQTIAGATTNYQYDEFDRLTAAIGGNMTYDARGNRTAAPSLAGPWSYSDDDELLSAGGLVFGSNARGDRTSRSGAAPHGYRYDSEGRLVELIANGISTTYTYDPFGRRLSKTTLGATTYFGYSDEGLIAEYDAEGNELRSYGYEPASEYGQRPLFLKVGSVYYWYIFDHLGTPLRLVDSSGAAVWAAAYDGMGSATVLVSAVENPMRYPGQYYDAESGLHYNWNRYYDPQVGRYLSRDPVRDEFNHFAYAQNDPLTKFDPDGLRFKISIPIPQTGGLCKVYTSLDFCECGVKCGLGEKKLGPVKCKADVELDLCNKRKDWPPKPRICAQIGCEKGPCKVELIKACYNTSSGKGEFSGPAIGCKAKGPGGIEVDGKTPPGAKNGPRDGWGY